MKRRKSFSSRTNFLAYDEEKEEEEEDSVCSLVLTPNTVSGFECPPKFEFWWPLLGIDR